MLTALFWMPSLLYSAETNTPAAKPLTPLGQLIDLGGYKMHLFCTGQGSPTVILSPGSGDFSFDWTLVQPKVAKMTRVCSYDHGGEAWSDLGPLPRTVSQEVFDLHRALAKANIPGPYILVGHSSGGMVMRLFAATYPTEVVGMVLVDGSHEEDTGNINGKMTTALALSKGRPIPTVRTNVTSADSLDDAAVKKIQEMVLSQDMSKRTDEHNERHVAEGMRRLWSVLYMRSASSPP
jgi:pimeloyl-ACP methyl ester carboxylesterase